MLIVESEPGEVDRAALAAVRLWRRWAIHRGPRCVPGVFARDYEQLQERLRMRPVSCALHSFCGRASASRSPTRDPRRAAQRLGDLLQFAHEIGAISCAKQAELERRSRQALEEVAAIQSCYHQGSDRRYVFCAFYKRRCWMAAHMWRSGGEECRSPLSGGAATASTSPGVGRARDENRLAGRK